MTMHVYRIGTLPQLPPTDTQYQCKPKPCGCDYITECDKCVPRLSYPCIKCKIPFFCAQPSICSDCKD